MTNWTEGDKAIIRSGSIASDRLTRIRRVMKWFVETQDGQKWSTSDGRRYPRSERSKWDSARLDAWDENRARRISAHEVAQEIDGNAQLLRGWVQAGGHNLEPDVFADLLLARELMRKVRAAVEGAE